MEEVEFETPVSFSEVTGAARSGFIAEICGNPMAAMIFEGQVFGLASRMIEGYNGGHWSFYLGSNGGRFLAPPFDGQKTLFCDTNGNEAGLGSVAAGMAITWIACSQMSFWAHRKGLVGASEKLSENHDLLRELIYAHEEAAQILHLCD